MLLALAMCVTLVKTGLLILLVLVRVLPTSQTVIHVTQQMGVPTVPMELLSPTVVIVILKQLSQAVKHVLTQHATLAQMAHLIQVLVTAQATLLFATHVTQQTVAQTVQTELLQATAVIVL